MQTRAEKTDKMRERDGQARLRKPACSRQNLPVRVRQKPSAGDGDSALGASREGRRNQHGRRDATRQTAFLLLPFFAAGLVLLYIRNASADVVYSDYIRLVNSYLPDALDPAKFFVPDVLTRIPFTYLARWVNLRFFSYSITFDRLLGLLGLLFSGLVLMRYALRVRLGFLWAALLIFLAFSLNKWEMLLNGSGYAHFLAFGCFFWNYLALERVYTGTAGRRDYMILLFLPWVTTLGLAGPYCAVYTVSLLLAYLYIWASGNRNVDKRWYPRWLLCTALPFCLYLLSNSFAVYEHAGAKDIGLLEALFGEFWFFPQFLLNGLASTFLGGETIEALMAQGALTQVSAWALGGLAAAAYLLAIFLCLRLKLYRRTIFPILLLVAGMGNHAVVLLGRYIFLDPQYAWASRYALQYQEGILGIVLIFALAVRELRAAAQKTGKRLTSGILYVMVISFSLAFLAGNCYTTYQELRKMPYREEAYEKMAQAAPHYRELDDKTLADLFEYRKGADQIRAAFGILEDNHLNVFRGSDAGA